MTHEVFTEGQNHKYKGVAMKGWLIFVHSVRLVFTNVETALRVSGVLYLALSVFQYWFSVKYGPVFQMMARGNVQNGVLPDAMFFMAWLVYVIASLVMTLWIAVAWHRYVLLEDISDGWFPRWRGDRIWAYFGRSVMVAFIAMIVAVIVGAITGLVMVPLGLEQIAALLAIVAAAFVFYRFGAALPAAAVGKSLSLGQAWRTTAGENATLLVLSLVTAVASYIVQLPGMMNSNPFSLISIVYSVVVGWFLTMIGVSILTTIYGHFIEKRSIG